MCSYGLFNGYRYFVIYYMDVGYEWFFIVIFGDKLIMKLFNEIMRIMGLVFVVLVEWGFLYICLEYWSFYFDNIWSFCGWLVWVKVKVFWVNFFFFIR